MEPIGMTKGSTSTPPKNVNLQPLPNGPHNFSHTRRKRTFSLRRGWFIMEKCRPANVRELEVKAERFIVSQWQGLSSPVHSRKVAVSSENDEYIIEDRWLIGFLRASTRSKDRFYCPLISRYSTNPITLHLIAKKIHSNPFWNQEISSCKGQGLFWPSDISWLLSK